MTFNTPSGKSKDDVILAVLNLVINGWPSIQKV